jgi:hypothetical protein
MQPEPVGATGPFHSQFGIDTRSTHRLLGVAHEGDESPPPGLAGPSKEHAEVDDQVPQDRHHLRAEPRAHPAGIFLIKVPSHRPCRLFSILPGARVNSNNSAAPARSRGQVGDPQDHLHLDPLTRAPLGSQADTCRPPGQSSPQYPASHIASPPVSASRSGPAPCPLPRPDRCRRRAARPGGGRKSRPQARRKRPGSRLAASVGCP